MTNYVCYFDGCFRGVRARGLCASHYEIQRKGLPLRPLGRSIVQGGEVAHGKASTYSNNKCRCSDCKEAWNLQCNESKRSRVGKELPPNREHGLPASYQWGCRCELCREANTAYCNEMRTIKTLGKALPSQTSCDCCGNEAGKLVIDHVHGTTHIRGMLCVGCNTAIGKLGDTLEGVLRAVEYLKQPYKT